MSIIQQTKCDGPNCTVVKQESNHWFWLIRQSTVEFGESSTRPADEHSRHRIFDLCGQQCLIATISGIVESQKATQVQS